MFSSILGNLTTLLPKNFIFASFVPVLIFGFVNGSMLFWSPAFREFAGPSFAGISVWAVSVLFVVAIVAAYVLSSLQDVMRLALEGAYVPEALAAGMRAREAARKQVLADDRNTARFDSIAIGRADKLIDDLTNARLAHGPRRPGYAASCGATRKQIADLAASAAAWRPVHARELRDAVNAAVSALQLYDRDAAVDADYRALSDVVTYARQETPAREIATYRRLEMTFGDGLPAPTRIGNIAATLTSYTVRRYNIDMETFWSRFQPVLQQKDALAYTAVLDAKTQLDFLIACWWLTVFTTAVWAPIFWFAGDSWVAAIVTVPIGTAVGLVLHRLATTAYCSYAEFVRACIDLNRFALLRALHVPLPNGLRQERALWSTMRRISEFGSSVVEVSYQHGEGQ